MNLLLVGDNCEWRQVEKLIEKGCISDIFIDTIDVNGDKDQLSLVVAVAAALETAPRGRSTTAWLLTRRCKESPLQPSSVHLVAHADSVLFVRAVRDSTHGEDGGPIVGSSVRLLKSREGGDACPPICEMAITAKGIRVVTH